MIAIQIMIIMIKKLILYLFKYLKMKLYNIITVKIDEKIVYLS